MTKKVPNPNRPFACPVAGDASPILGPQHAASTQPPRRGLRKNALALAAGDQGQPGLCFVHVNHYLAYSGRYHSGFQSGQP